MIGPQSLPQHRRKWRLSMPDVVSTLPNKSASGTVSRLVPPPSLTKIAEAELDQAALLIPTSQILHHLHQRQFSANSFNPGIGNGRFHPIQTQDGVSIPTFYAANTEEGAYCETLLRALDVSGLSQRFIPSKRVWGYCYAQLQTQTPLRLAQLSGNQLIRLGLTRSVLLEPGPPHYPATSAWAAAIHATYPQLHGIAWISRQHDTSTCYMLFGDRVSESHLSILNQQDLATAQGRQMVDSLARRLNIVITR